MISVLCFGTVLTRIGEGVGEGIAKGGGEAKGEAAEGGNWTFVCMSPWAVGVMTPLHGQRSQDVARLCLSMLSVAHPSRHVLAVGCVSEHVWGMNIPDMACIDKSSLESLGESRAYAARMACPNESVSRRSRGNAGRFDASQTAPYVLVMAVKAETCAYERDLLTQDHTHQKRTGPQKQADRPRHAMSRRSLIGLLAQLCS